MAPPHNGSLRNPAASTGIPGLDAILPGGFTRDHVYLIEGDPGTGKTTLALQFLMAGAEAGEKGLYVTLSESAAELQGVAQSHHWSLDHISIFELTPVEANLLTDSQYTVFHPEEVELGETTRLILDRIEQEKPARLVLDSVAELRLLAHDSMRYRRQVLALKQYFTGRQITVLLLDDRTSRSEEKHLHSIVHGVIVLERLPRDYGKGRRRLEVSKLRGSAFQEGYHDYSIETGGIVVYPRLIAAQHHSEFQEGTISSDVPGLDQLLGGGLDRGSAILFVGPAGAGKSTLAIKYVATALQRSEPVTMYTFDEGVNSLLLRADALGMPLRESAAAGTLKLEQVDPAELSPGEFVQRVRNSVERDKARMIVIDSLNGYLAAMPEEQFLTLQMHELLTYLNQQGVVTILILSQPGVLGQAPSVVDISYLADSIVLLRFFEAMGEVHRSIAVVKKRTSRHEHTIREFQISEPGGIQVGAPLRDFRGVLTGVPDYIGAASGLQNTSREPIGGKRPGH